MSKWVEEQDRHHKMQLISLVLRVKSNEKLYDPKKSAYLKTVQDVPAALTHGSKYIKHSSFCDLPWLIQRRQLLKSKREAQY